MYGSTSVLYYVLPNKSVSDRVIELRSDQEVLDIIDKYTKARLFNIPVYAIFGPTMMTFSRIVLLRIVKKRNLLEIKALMSWVTSN